MRVRKSVKNAVAGSPLIPLAHQSDVTIHPVQLNDEQMTLITINPDESHASLFFPTDDTRQEESHKRKREGKLVKSSYNLRHKKIKREDSMSQEDEMLIDDKIAALTFKLQALEEENNQLDAGNQVLLHESGQLQIEINLLDQTLSAPQSSAAPHPASTHARIVIVDSDIRLNFEPVVDEDQAPFNEPDQSPYSYRY